MDPNFAPLDPADLDPPLSPVERVKRGFEATRVADRTAPGYPGAFLGTGDVFDPAQRQFLKVPVDATFTPAPPFKSPSYSREMARRLGSEDIDREADAKIIAWAKKLLGH